MCRRGLGVLLLPWLHVCSYIGGVTICAVTLGPCGPIAIRLQDSSLSNGCAMENLVKTRRSDVQKSNVSTSECLRAYWLVKCQHAMYRWLDTFLVIDLLAQDAVL